MSPLLCRGRQLFAVLLGLTLAGCGGSSHTAKAYEGQWFEAGMGETFVRNLRADGTFSDVTYADGLIGDLTKATYAAKGTYTFEPDVAGDYTAGSLFAHYTHEYDFMADAWIALSPAEDYTLDCTVDASGSTPFLTCDGEPHEYYGPEAAIPTTF